MKNSTANYSKPKQAILPIFISDYLDICDPVLVFDRFMEEIDLEKYLHQISAHVVERIRYNPASMLKTVLFGFMTYGYISLRELEDNCKVNLRFMYLMEHKTPSYRTFGYFINEILKFEANANKYSWVYLESIHGAKDVSNAKTEKSTH